MNELIETPGLSPFQWIVIGLFILAVVMLGIGYLVERKIKSRKPGPYWFHYRRMGDG